MTGNLAIKVEGVSKTFRLPHEKQTSLKSTLINFRKRGYEKQKALDEVSFEVRSGEFFGIVGRNGSGKSTLLKLLAGIYSPSKGNVQINGKLTPFIELGVGFNPELTGRENVFLNGALLGFSRKEMQAMYKDIVQFAELERFMDQKLKNYSSGMQVRLAFSIAIKAQADILLIDEVLAVGDANFQRKCFEYFRKLKSSNKTVVFVSHDRGAVEEFCDRAILINDGEILSYGDTKEVLKNYNQVNIERLNQQTQKTDKSKREGRGDAKILKCEILNGGKQAQAFGPDDVITVKVTTKFNSDTEQPVYGLVINRSGEPPIFATNTQKQNLKTKDQKKDSLVITTYTFKNYLGNGQYLVSPAVASSDTLIMYDWREGMKEFASIGWDDEYLPVHIEHTIKVK